VLPDKPQNDLRQEANHLLIGYNQATSLKHSDLETDIAMCKKHGFDGLEMQADLMDKYMSCHSFDDLKKLFADSGVKALPVNAFCDFNIQSKENTERLHYLCKCANASGANTLILVPALSDISPGETIKAITALMVTAKEYGVVPALEFLGFANSSVRSLEEALNIAGQIDGGLRVVLDCAHIMAGTTEVSTILKLKPEQIMTVHINDLNRKPSEIYSDSDRVWPGDGDMGLRKILENLKAIGYDGIYSIELFNEEIWELPVNDIFSSAIRKVRDML